MSAAPKIPSIRLSGFYFFHFCILGVFLPYWPLYLREVGFDPAEIGLLMAILPATKVLSPSLWGWLADRTGRTLGLIRWTSFLALGAFVPVFGLRSFGGLASVTLAFSFFWNATLPLFETVTLNHLRRQAERYSRVRLWGSIGFIGAVWALGEGLDLRLPIAGLPGVIVLLLAGQGLASLLVPLAPGAYHAEGQGSLRNILRRGEVMALLLACLLLQIAHGPYYVFFSVYLQDHGFSGRETGQLWALGVLAEIVLFGLMHRVLDRCSLRGLLLASLGLSGVRWLPTAWGIDHLALILVAQLLHAFTFGAAHVASIHLVYRRFRGRHQAQGQALYSALSFGLGGAVGSLSGGLLWTVWGPHWVYTAAAGLSLLALLIAWSGVERAETL